MSVILSHCNSPSHTHGPNGHGSGYRDILRATFTCTAFGGDNTQLEFSWIAPNDATGFDTSTFVQYVNEDNSTTSNVSTLPLSLSDRGQSYTCDVAYEGVLGSDNEASATLNIGM